MFRPIQKKTRRLLTMLTLLGVYGGLAPSTADAWDLNITALFKPDPSNPQKNEFRNTTQQSGYCYQHPTNCENPQLVSFRLPLTFRTSAPIPAHHPQETQGVMLGVPGQWRRLQVVHSVTGKVEDVEVRLAGIGTTHVVTVPVQTLVGDSMDTSSTRSWHRLWEGGGWSGGAGPCKTTGYEGSSSYIYGFFLRIEETDGICAKKALFDVPQLEFAYLDVGYQLRTPKPLDMPTGVYVGSIPYTLGPGGDINTGNNLLPEGDSQVNLIFTLTVEHELKVDIPPGGEKIRLVPAGGWQSWLQAGRRPVNLFRDQTFNISASSRFKMQIIACGPGFNGECGLQDSRDIHRVELHISVSMPNGITDLAGQPVKRARLKSGNANALYFKPGFYVDRAPGTLHFEVPPHSMANMLQPGVSDSYSGTVVVVWDSDI